MQDPRMSTRVARRLPALSADYEKVTGKPFDHFFCPVLYRDDANAELCEAHIVNKAFGASSSWTVQRKDVDGFYGSHFEADFLALKDRDRSGVEVLVDPLLAHRFRPSVSADERPVEYYALKPKQHVPDEHSHLILEGPWGEKHIALKMPPAEVAAVPETDWRIAFEMDVRVPALVSLLKAAHLTLFNMLGYQYALSPAGHFLGYEILGKFFLANARRSKADVIAAAHPHFREFASMVRPVLNAPNTLKGTADDNMVFLCESGDIRWGLVVWIRTSPTQMHAVLAPLFQEPVGARRFFAFLDRSTDEDITVRRARCLRDRWDASTRTESHRWPKTGTMYPEEPPHAAT
jgi:hypothetical protein